MADVKKKAKIFAIIGVILLIFCYCFSFAMGYIILDLNDLDFNTEFALMNITNLITILTFLSGIILLVIAGILYYIHRKDVNKPKNSAKKILYERYAKGEISKEELEQMKKDLGD